MGKCLLSIWVKMNNSKIPHFKFCRFFKPSVTKIMRKIAVWRILCFSPLSSLNNVEEQLAKLASSHVIFFQHFIWGEGKFYMHFLKFPYFVTDCLKFTKPKKEGFRCMLFQITQIYFNKCAYATLHSAMRIMTESGAKTTQKLSQKWF